MYLFHRPSGLLYRTEDTDLVLLTDVARPEEFTEADLTEENSLSLSDALNLLVQVDHEELTEVINEIVDEEEGSND